MTTQSDFDICYNYVCGNISAEQVKMIMGEYGASFFEVRCQITEGFRNMDWRALEKMAEDCTLDNAVLMIVESVVKGEHSYLIGYRD